MQAFKHYITTRFNAGLYNPQANLRVPPEQWMAHRMRLFTTFTLPSIMGQSCQDFTWLVLMDKQTPDRYIRMLEDAGYPNMKLIYPIPGQAPWQRAFPDGQYDLITSRIDNDDAFHRDMIKTVQGAWSAQHEQRRKPWVVVFPFGLIMDLARRQAWVMEYWFNNCPTLVEDSLDPRTIWQWDHSRIPPEVDRCFIKDKPYWLQVVHSQNLLNALRSGNPDKIVHEELPAGPDHLRHFNVDANTLPEA